MTSAPKPRRLRIGFLVVAGVVASLFLAVYLPSIIGGEEGLEAAAKKCADAVCSGDARVVLGYMRDGEVSSLRLDAEKLQEFIDVSWNNRVRVFQQRGQDRFERIEGAGVLMIYRDFEDAKGADVTLVLTVARTEDGAKLTRASQEIFLAGLRAGWPKGERPPAADPMRLFATALESSLPSLEAIQLTGAAIPDNGGYRFMTWRQMLADFERRAKRPPGKEG